MHPILDKHLFGPWAVITDSSSGIGKAIPRQLGSRGSSKKIAFWIATVLVCVAFLGSGIANVVHAPHIAADMARLGYPAYFSSILGAWKVLGAVAIVARRLPRLKEWAYAGMIFDLSGAAISRGVSGDGAAGVIPPLVVAVLVVASWALRPEDRVLASTTPRATSQ